MKSLLLRAIELQNQSDFIASQSLLREYLGHFPDDPVALYSYGFCLLKEGHFNDALLYFDTGIRSSPTFYNNWIGAAHALNSMGRRVEALDYYEKAFEISRQNTNDLNNCGVIYREIGSHLKALTKFDEALAVSPTDVNSLANSAIILSEFKQTAEAIRRFKLLKSIDPHYKYLDGLILYEQLKLCDWSEYDQLQNNIVVGVMQDRPVCKTLAFMSVCDDPALHLKCAQIFSKNFSSYNIKPFEKAPNYNHDKLVIAYISPDFREHPVCHLIIGMLERHDKSRFVTVGISLGLDDGSSLRGRAQKAFDHFIDANLMSSHEIAQKIRSLEVDILIDLAGYTSDCRLDIFAYRPAPVQVTYLGYPGTLATSYVDYIIADRIVIPDDKIENYTETVLYLPDAYLPFDDTHVIPFQKFKRSDFNLPDNAFVFCCFSHDYKISPTLWSVWISLLKKIPNSVLWLSVSNPDAQNNLRQSFASQGLDAERLIFATRITDIDDHLARYDLADVFLDSWPYNAHTTAVDALMSGLPVITYLGQSFPSRVAASVLVSCDLSSLVCNSLQEYEMMALKIAFDKDWRISIKEKLRQDFKEKKIFNTKSFTRKFENMLIDTHERHFDI